MEYLNTTKELVLDNTKRSTFDLCNRKFYWHHHRGLVPAYGSTAIRYGACFHACLEGYYKTIKERGWKSKDEAVVAGAELARKTWDQMSSEQLFYDDYRTLEACMEAFLKYIVEFQLDEGSMEIVETEQVFEYPVTLISQEEKRLFGHLPPIFFTGRIDKQMKLSGMNWMSELKTTGQPIDQQSQRLQRSSQLIGYCFAGKHMLKFDPAGILITIHRLYAGRLKDGSYGKLSIDFRRVPQIFTEGDYREWRLSFLSTCGRIYDCLVRNIWPQQYDSCYHFGSCPYLPLCTQNRDNLDDTITDNFIFRPWDVRKEGNSE